MKQLCVVFCLTVSVFALAGCTPAPQAKEQSLFPSTPPGQVALVDPIGPPPTLPATPASSKPPASSQDGAGATQPPASQTPPPQQQSQQTNQVLGAQQIAELPKGAGVKTLKDFDHVSAQTATISTNKGDITLSLYSDKVPLTVTNFLTLAKKGFYSGVRFHRIIPNFMAQVGDPLTRDDSQQALWGTGGPGYTIQDEFDPTLKHDGPGVVSMANTGQPNTGGSQFFITFEATPWLDGHHAVFAKVTSGMDVVNKLVIGDQINNITFK